LGKTLSQLIGSSFVDTFLHRIFRFAYGLLGIAFYLLGFTFGSELRIVSGFAYALLDVTDGFVGHTFDFVASATHGDSPKSKK